jgi:uncharacterized protein
MKSESITAIMILSSYCNLDCTYCYALKGLEHPRGKEKMSVEVAAESISQLLELPVNRIDFNWHGGEPLIIGRNQFSAILDKQCELVQRYPYKTIHNKIQTNGTLVNEKWVGFFKKYGLGVGISIDGPSQLHNQHRPLPDNRESFKLVARGITFLKDGDIPGGKLLVITPTSLNFVDEIFDFIKHSLQDIDIIPCFHVDKRTGQNIWPTISPEEFGHFLTQLFDLWFEEDNPQIYIRFFNDSLKALLGGYPTLCSLSKGCRSFITIDWNGDVYPCDNFSGYPEFKLGNVFEHNLSKILAEQKYNQIMEQMTQIPDGCHDCSWLKVCQGGCSHQSYMPGKAFNHRSYFCLSRRLFFEHAAKRLRESNLDLIG